MERNEWSYISTPLGQKRIQSTMVGILTGLQAGKSMVQIPAETRDFHLLCNIKIGSVANAASYLMGTRGPFPSKGGDGGVGGDKAAGTLRLTIHLRLM
jgi:hypothetical protein